MKPLPTAAFLALALLSAAGCSQKTDEPMAASETQGDTTPLPPPPQDPKVETTPSVSQHDLSILVSAYPAEQKEDTSPTEILLSSLDNGVSHGCSFGGFTGGRYTTIDEDGRFGGGALPERQGPSGGYWLSRKDTTTLKVHADYSDNGGSYEATGELKIEPERRTVFRFPGRGEPRYLFIFEIPATKPPE